MCFLCGVFVPMNVMDKKVLKVAQFLPVYWYEQVNELPGEYTTLTEKATSQIYQAINFSHFPTSLSLKLPGIYDNLILIAILCNNVF